MKIFKACCGLIVALLAMILPYLVETGTIKIQNKILFYSLLVFLILFIGIIVLVLTKVVDYKNKTSNPKATLLLELKTENNNERIQYELGRMGIKRKEIRIVEEKNSIYIILNKNSYQTILAVNKKEAILYTSPINLDLKASIASSTHSKSLDSLKKEEVFHDLVKYHESLS